MRLSVVAQVGLVLALCTSVAEAQDTDLNYQIAKRHFELGAKLYEASNFAEALAEFNKAYELTHKPALLFNIARCHEVLGHLKQALEFYRRFLRELPERPERPVVEVRVKNLERRLREQGQPADQRASPASAQANESVAPPPPSPPGQSPAPDRRRSWRWKAGWVAIAVGGASLIAGIACGGVAHSKASEFDEGVTAGRPFAELDEIDGAGKSANTAMIATLVVGGVVAAGGLGLILWDRARNTEQPTTAAGPRLSPFVGGDGAGLLLRGTF